MNVMPSLFSHSLHVGALASVPQLISYQLFCTMCQGVAGGGGGEGGEEREGVGKEREAGGGNGLLGSGRSHLLV